MDKTDKDTEASMSGGNDEMALLCQQMEDMYNKLDFTQLLESYKDGLTSPDDFNSYMADFKSRLDTVMETVRELRNSNMSDQKIEELKLHGDISIRSRPGRRKTRSGDSGLGSSAFGSVTSFKCPTCSSNSVKLSSSLISNIQESREQMVQRFIETSDFKGDKEPSEITSDTASPFTETQTENDLSKPTATENTESSISDNEKQPGYSSDESRLSSMNSVLLVPKGTQTDLCALVRLTSNLSPVTETFYELVFEEENVGDSLPENENSSPIANDGHIVV